MRSNHESQGNYLRLSLLSSELSFLLLNTDAKALLSYISLVSVSMNDLSVKMKPSWEQ